MIDKKGRNFFYSKSGNAKSVRKNCFWVQVEGVKYLVSYQTIVCGVFEDGYFAKYWDGYSVTTMNQIKRFIELFGEVVRNDTGEVITGLNKKEWLEMQQSVIDIVAYETIPKLLPEIIWNCQYRNDYAVKIIYS